MSRDRVAEFRAGFGDEVDDVVVDHDGGHDHVGAAFARAVREKGGVNEDAAVDAANAFGADLFGERFDDGEWIAGQSGTAVGVIFVHESEGVVRLNAIGKIGIAAGDEDEVALESTFFVDGAGAIDVRCGSDSPCQVSRGGCLR